MRNFLFTHIGIWTGDLWILNPALYKYATVNSGFDLWQLQVFYSGAEGLVVVMFWLDYLREFCFADTGIWTGDLWILNPALYKYATVNSGFDLWQLQVFNSGAEGLVVVMFWLDYLREFCFAHNGIWAWDVWISSPVVKHYATVTSGFHLWQCQVFYSGAGGLVVVLSWLELWENIILLTLGFELETSGSEMLHSINVPQWLLVLNSDDFRYLTLVQRDCWC